MGYQFLEIIYIYNQVIIKDYHNCIPGVLEIKFLIKLSEGLITLQTRRLTKRHKNSARSGYTIFYFQPSAGCYRREGRSQRPFCCKQYSGMGFNP